MEQHSSIWLPEKPKGKLVLDAKDALHAIVADTIGKYEKICAGYYKDYQLMSEFDPRRMYLKLEGIRKKNKEKQYAGNDEDKYYEFSLKMKYLEQFGRRDNEFFKYDNRAHLKVHPLVAADSVARLEDDHRRTIADLLAHQYLKADERLLKSQKYTDEPFLFGSDEQRELQDQRKEIDALKNAHAAIIAKTFNVSPEYVDPSSEDLSEKELPVWEPKNTNELPSTKHSRNRPKKTEGEPDKGE